MDIYFIQRLTPLGFFFKFQTNLTIDFLVYKETTKNIASVQYAAGRRIIKRCMYVLRIQSELFVFN